MSKKSTSKDVTSKPSMSNPAPAKAEAPNKTASRARGSHKASVRSAVETAPAATGVAAAVAPVAPVTAPSHEEIAVLAYSLWQERGCTHGDAEHDWLRAEQMLRSR